MSQTENPLAILHQQREAMMLPYERAGTAVQVPGAFDAVPIEYASLRTGCAVLDQPHHGVIEVTGADRIGFLQRMVTQDLAGLGERGVRRAFWLNRRGRIEGDLALAQTPVRMLIDVEVHAAKGVAESLAPYVFSEDVSIRYEEGAWRRLGVYGLKCGEALTQAGLPSMQVGACAEGAIDGAEVVCFRDDWIGVPAYELFVRGQDAARVYERLTTHARPVGWLAVNILRIETGVPLFGVDYSTTSLPAETGLLQERVSFKKGCYLGQEVVARMYSLGKPKQVVVALRFEGERAKDGTGLGLVPDAGSAVMAEGDESKQVGAITSATLSPMLGSELIALATVKTASAEAGTVLSVEAGGYRLRAIVQPHLWFVK